MEKSVVSFSLRYNALYIPDNVVSAETVNNRALSFAVKMADYGFMLSPELLLAVSGMDDGQIQDYVKAVESILGIGLNWASLRKNWLTPPENTWEDVKLGWLFNELYPYFPESQAIELPCGHVLPKGFFPLEKYNGCPICGTPFELADFVLEGQSNPRKLLNLWRDKDVYELFRSIMESPVAPQESAVETIKEISSLPISMPHVLPATKEMMLLYCHYFAGADRLREYLTTPSLIFSYLWYLNTDILRFYKPSTIYRQIIYSYTSHGMVTRGAEQALEKRKDELKLKYDRHSCRLVADLLENCDMTPEQMCADMHPRRQMWVRFIRALRLTEFARRKQYPRLRSMLDLFYRKDYKVWAGEVAKAATQKNEEQVLKLLKMRPGIFARLLFSTMLTFDAERVAGAFVEIGEAVPPRLLVTLSMYAYNYFNSNSRVVQPNPTTRKDITANPKVLRLSQSRRDYMTSLVRNTMQEALRRHYMASVGDTFGKKVYIDPQLYHIPLGIGDRGQAVQQTSTLLQGQQIPVEGDKLRVFLQWGEGLPRMTLDMDLSGLIIYEDGAYRPVAYFNLSCEGAVHSGDIRSIPDNVGTAEYIELDLPALEKSGAKQVFFMSNAYSVGTINPNLKLGWMSSKYTMVVDENTGVAYDPSTVQMLAAVDSSNLSRGLVFAALDVEKRQVTWLEYPFPGQNINDADADSINLLLQRLESKMKIGELLRLRADALGQQLAAKPEEADETYTLDWASNPANPAELLLK